eukprot:GHVU01004346.1.p1 GENE.GHVU01004346.1~~GHVU01004346.1.p1  ORF type:complete len:301 (+),score=82.85 GHVU01004346.1:45-947(+)
MEKITLQGNMEGSGSTERDAAVPELEGAADSVAVAVKFFADVLDKTTTNSLRRIAHVSRALESRLNEDVRRITAEDFELKEFIGNPITLSSVDVPEDGNEMEPLDVEALLGDLRSLLSTQRKSAKSQHGDGSLTLPTSPASMQRKTSSAAPSPHPSATDAPPAVEEGSSTSFTAATSSKKAPSPKKEEEDCHFPGGSAAAVPPSSEDVTMEDGDAVSPSPDPDVAMGDGDGAGTPAATSATGMRGRSTINTEAESESAAADADAADADAAAVGDAIILPSVSPSSLNRNDDNNNNNNNST